MSGERCCQDRGQFGGAEVLPFGFLIFVAAMLVVANAWGVIDAKLAVTAAAREAVRVYVESPDAATAQAAAQRRAGQTMAAYGRGGSRVTITTPVVVGGFRRCGRVTMTVSYEVPIVAVPFIGGLGKLRPVTSSYTELIDPFRSGLAGTARC